MFKEEVKENLLALLTNSHHEWIEKDYYELYIQKVDIDRLTDILMNGVIGDLLRERDEEIKQRERFAEQEGFTPDCSPYYIALQYKHKMEVAERALKEKCPFNVGDAVWFATKEECEKKAQEYKENKNDH